MNEPLEIARDDMVLGWLSEDDVRELLAAGFLKPTDFYRRDKSPGWRPLSLLAEPEPKESQLLRKVARTAGVVGAIAGRTAVKAGKGAISLVSGAKDTLDENGRRLLEGAMPAIRQSVAAQLQTPAIQKAKSRLQDREFMRKVFGAAYDCLPKPVTRFVSEEQFIRFCEEHRRQLIGDTSALSAPPDPTGIG